MTREEVHAIVMSFPQVEEAASYGKPAYKAFGKFFTRVRESDQGIVLGGVGFDEREMLMEAEPATFFVLPHYYSYPYVLARMASLDPGSFREMLKRRWRELAPKKYLKTYDAARADA
jgi:hypothetical protein